MSTDLSQLVTEVTSGVDKLVRRDGLREQLRGLGAVEKATDGLLEQLRGLERIMAATRQAGFAPRMPDPTEEVAGLRKLVTQLAAVDVDREFAQKVIDAVREVLRTADDALTDSWREYVTSRVPAQEGLVVLAQTFRVVEGATGNARDLQAAAVSVQALLKHRPSVEAVQALDKLAREIPLLLQRLVGEEVAVSAFADQLARGGAAIEALTPSVLTWMRDKGFTASFKIVPGRPAGRESA